MSEREITFASTTSSVAELEHAASDDWRDIEAAPKEEVKPEPEKGKSEAESETAIGDSKPGNVELKVSKNGYEKRIDRLTARNKAIETEAAELRSRLESLERGKETPAKVSDPTEPRAENYKTLDEWHDARFEWKKQQEARQQEQSANEEQTRETWDAHNSRLSEARARYDDFDEVAESAAKMSIPQSAALAIIEQDNSADVVYFLAKNPEEAQKISEMSPMKQIAAIARISDKLSSKKEEPPKQRPTSSAPVPIKPVGSASSGTTVDPGSMSYQDYKAARNSGRLR